MSARASQPAAPSSPPSGATRLAGIVIAGVGEQLAERDRVRRRGGGSCAAKRELRSSGSGVVTTQPPRTSNSRRSSPHEPSRRAIVSAAPCDPSHRHGSRRRYLRRSGRRRTGQCRWASSSASASRVVGVGAAPSGTELGERDARRGSRPRRRARPRRAARRRRSRRSPANTGSDEQDRAPPGSARCAAGPYSWSDSAIDEHAMPVNTAANSAGAGERHRCPARRSAGCRASATTTICTVGERDRVQPVRVRALVHDPHREQHRARERPAARPSPSAEVGAGQQEQADGRDARCRRSPTVAEPAAHDAPRRTA